MTVDTYSPRLYDPRLHTGDSLASQLDLLRLCHPDAIVVGSLGRAAIFREILGDPNYEYTMRSQDPLRKQSMARDIDLTSQESDFPPGPFPIDTTAFSGNRSKLVQENNIWFLTADRHGFAEELRPDVMELAEKRTVYDAMAQVLPAQTQLEILHLNGYKIPKVQRAFDILSEVLEGSGRPKLPVEHYGPFRKLSKLNRTPVVRFRYAYRDHIPLAVRQCLLPVTRVVSRRI